MSLESLVGTATVISSLAGRFVGYPAQIRLILKTRIVSNLSVSLHSIGFISCLLWAWHGWLQRDWVILLTMGAAGIATTGTMLFLIWRFRPRAMAAESIAALLVHLAAIDGEVHPAERQEVETFARKWQLAVHWDVVQSGQPAALLGEAALQHLRRYLASHPPVEQMREFRDMVWLLAEADGHITPDERVLAAAIQRDLALALLPFGEPESGQWRVVLASDPGELPAGFGPGRLAQRQVAFCGTTMTEPIARQYSAELRSQGLLAFALSESEFEERDDPVPPQAAPNIVEAGQ